jgi:hypothetical protein
MKVGDKIVCIDARPGFLDGVVGLVEGQIYTALFISHRFEYPEVVVHHGDLGWRQNRFRPLTFGEQETEKVLEHFSTIEEFERERSPKPKKETV